MLKYTKQLGMGMTFFALWVLMAPQNARIEYNEDKKVNPICLMKTRAKVYEPYIKYFRTKKDCEDWIKVQAVWINKDGCSPDTHSTKIGNGFCVKTSDL